MNMYYDDGGSAFPWPPVGTGDPRDGMAGGSSGMSLRDYFAAAALDAYLAGRNIDQRDSFPAGVASICYSYADAMLAERSKRNGGAS